MQTSIPSRRRQHTDLQHCPLALTGRGRGGRSSGGRGEARCLSCIRGERTPQLCLEKAQTFATTEVFAIVLRFSKTLPRRSTGRLALGMFPCIGKACLCLLRSEGGAGVWHCCRKCKPCLSININLYNELFLTLEEFRKHMDTSYERLLYSLL